jgi:hypothetical protein
MISLLIKVACFVKKYLMFEISQVAVACFVKKYLMFEITQVADLNWQVHGGNCTPFSNDSLTVLYLKPGLAILSMSSLRKNGYKHTVYMVSISQKMFVPGEMYEPKVH